MAEYNRNNTSILSGTLKKLIIFIIIAALVFFGIKFAIEKLYPTEYSEYVEKYSAAYDVDESLVYAVIKTESNFDPNAVSSVDAKGLMQMKKETFEWVMTKMGVEGYTHTYSQIFEPEVSIKYGTFLLSILLKEYEGDETTALCAYYAGRDTVNQWLSSGSGAANKNKLIGIPNGSVEAYVNKVLRNKDIYDKLVSK